MQFTTFSFFLFFLVFFTCVRSVASKNARVHLLLVGSYIFYAAISLPYVLYLVYITTVDFILAKLAYAASETKKKRYLFLSICNSLGILIFFKYTPWLLSIVEYFSTLLRVKVSVPGFALAAPIGISYITFRSIGYVYDVYAGKIEPEWSWEKYAVFIAFFPNIFAGPIMRAETFLPQLAKKRKVSKQILNQGFLFFTLGLFSKVVIADNISEYANRLFDNRFTVNFSQAWIGAYAFAIQIYTDFSGYSLMAIGVALIIGFYTPQNFNLPYGADSVADFWRRWHISLSSWLRDYVFLPLNFALRGRWYAFSLATFVTFVLCGLWHGSDLHYLVWGAVHGALIIIETVLGFNVAKNLTLRIKFLRSFLIFHIILISWVLFRATLSKALYQISVMLCLKKGISEITLYSTSVGVAIIGLGLCLFFVQFWLAQQHIPALFKKIKSDLLYGALIGLLWGCIIMLGGKENAFIYLQF